MVIRPDGEEKRARNMLATRGRQRTKEIVEYACMLERRTPSPLSEVFDGVSDESHPLTSGNAHGCVVFGSDGKEEDEAAAGLEGVSSEADEVVRKMDELVGSEGREILHVKVSTDESVRGSVDTKKSRV
jgi:hypothetical protein